MTGFSQIRTAMLYRAAAAVVTAVVIGGLSSAAYALGPDNYGYTAAATTISFEDLSVSGGPATPILYGMDDSAVTIPIGFSFTFYGVTFTNVSVSSNGILTFGGVDTDLHPIDFRTAAPAGNLKTIAPLWHDWTFDVIDTDQAYYYTTGNPGSRRLVIQWNKAQSVPGNGFDFVTFEVKLLEGSNNIEFHFKDPTVGDDITNSNGLGSTVGIRDVNGQSTTNRNLVWSFNQAIISANTAVKFTAPQFAIKSVSRQLNGSNVLQCTGAPSKPNFVEATSDLMTAFTRLIPSVTADAAGNFQFTDATPGTRRFYRVGYP